MCAVGNICSGGVCVINTACNSNTDCGTNGLLGSLSCDVNGDVIDTYRTFTCNNPGTASASCSQVDTAQVQEVCTNGCTGSVCNPGLPDGDLCTLNTECLSDICSEGGQCSSYDIRINSIGPSAPRYLESADTALTTGTFITNLGSATIPANTPFYLQFRATHTTVGGEEFIADLDGVSFAYSVTPGMSSGGMLGNNIIFPDIANNLFVNGWYNVEWLLYQDKIQQWKGDYSNS